MSKRSTVDGSGSLHGCLWGNRGHTYPGLAVVHALQTRGHRVTPGMSQRC